MLAEGDENQAAQLYQNRCSNCHEIGKGAVNASGPHLNNLLGRTMGSVDSYRYSNSLRQANEMGEVWTEQALLKWLTNPVEYIAEVTEDKAAHSRMSYRVKDESDRQRIVEYLSQLPEHSESVSSAQDKCLAAPKANVDFRDCDLVRVDFSKVDLRNAQLQNANLISANLSEADLSGADLSGASLGGADLRGANLEGANLSGVTMVKSLIPGANLKGAIFKNVIFVNAKRCAPESIGACE